MDYSGKLRSRFSVRVDTEPLHLPGRDLRLAGSQVPFQNMCPLNILHSYYIFRQTQIAKLCHFANLLHFFRNASRSGTNSPKAL